MIPTNTPAWARLGHTFPTPPASIEQALRDAQLTGWNVRTEPLATTSGLEVPRHHASVRTNPRTGHPEVLGVVGRNYRTIQNEEAFGFASAIIDDGEVTVETVGSLNGGRAAWLLLRLPQTIAVGDDLSFPYLLTRVAHDGSAAVVSQFTTLRYFCANMNPALRREDAATYRIRHTLSATARIEEARAALGVAYAGLDAFQQEANRMLDQQITDATFAKIVEALLPDPDDAESEAGATRRAARRAALHAAYRSEANANIVGTAWGAWNAYTEWSDHRSMSSPTRTATRAMRLDADLAKRHAATVIRAFA